MAAVAEYQQAAAAAAAIAHPIQKAQATLRRTAEAEAEAMTRSSSNWQRAPGSFDVLHIRRRHYPGNNRWGFPDLLPQTFTLPDELPLLSYKERDDSGKRHAQALCHFFLDDYRFEAVWTKPDAGLNRIRRFWGTLTPDFSLYTDWPNVIQQWNHYRRQWLGRYWQEYGVRVIPTVNWSTTDSFEWCFAGIQQQQIVALAVPDMRQRITRHYFMQGFEAMLETLHPSHLLIYGKLPVKVEIPCTEIKPDWIRLRESISLQSSCCNLVDPA